MNKVHAQIHVIIGGRLCGGRRKSHEVRPQFARFFYTAPLLCGADGGSTAHFYKSAQKEREKKRMCDERLSLCGSHAAALNQFLTLQHVLLLLLYGWVK